MRLHTLTQWNVSINITAQQLFEVRDLHCNLTIMGLNRWWLKLFFTCLMWGTSNALVLYNESQKIRAAEYKPMNIVDFKLRLFSSLSRENAQQSVKETTVGHLSEKIPNEPRSKCAYCSIQGRDSRSRYRCQTCGIPLCSIFSGKVEHDYFTECHTSEQVQQLTVMTECRNQQTIKARKILILNNTISEYNCAIFNLINECNSCFKRYTIRFDDCVRSCGTLCTLCTSRYRGLITIFIQ